MTIKSSIEGVTGRLNPTQEADLNANTAHRQGDGSDHADVASNTTHRGRTDNPHGVTAAQANAVAKVASTDNAVPRFDGTSGDVQNSDVYIDDNGNLGVGINNPDSPITVDGQVKIFQDGNTDLYTLLDGRRWVVTNDSGSVSQDISPVATNNTDQVNVRLFRSGWSTGNASLQIFQVQNSEPTNTLTQALINAKANSHSYIGRSSGDSLSIGAKSKNGTNTLHVNGTASKTQGGTTWASVSDERLKDVGDKYSYGLDEINQLVAVYFKYKKDNPRELPSDIQQMGFIAQEVQEVIPDAVSKDDDGYLSLNMDPILLAMLNAIKELSNKVSTLQEELDELKK